MAHVSACAYERICLYCSIDCISNFKIKPAGQKNNFMEIIIQNIFAFSALAMALLYLFKTFVWWPKKSTSKSCGTDGGCGCH
jgi:hypothetical protein